MDPKTIRFLTNFGPILGAILGSIFVSLFFEALELLGCLLGAFLGFLRLFWDASGPQKPLKTFGFLRFLQKQLFGSFKLLIALLGSSWPLLGPIWSQNGPQNGPQNCLKVVPKIVQKMASKKVHFRQILGPKLGPKIGNFGGTAAQSERDGALLEALVFKMAPRWLKMASRSPR